MPLSTIDLIAWGILIIALCILGFFGVWALWRKFKAYVFIIVRDYRNPDKGSFKYYAVPNKDDKSIKYYNNLFTPWMSRKVPLVYDPAAFADDTKRVRLIRSPTGKPGDDMDVPIGLSLNSQGAARDYARMVSDSVSYMIPFYEKCKKLDIRIGESAIIMAKRRGVTEKINGTITGASFLGIDFSYQNGLDEKGKPIIKKVLITEDQVDELKLTMTSEDRKKLDPLGYSDFFNEEWVMQKFGIRKVEDANIITIPSKTAIAQFNTGNNEFIKDGQGFFQKNIGAVLGLMCLVLFGVAVLLAFYGGNTFYAGITADVAGYQATHSGPATTILATTTIPQATTTIGANGSTSPVNIGGG